MSSPRRVLAALIVLLSAPLGAQIHSGAPPDAPIDAPVEAQEDRDEGVPPTAGLRLEAHSAPTPIVIPGATRILTEALRTRLAGAEPPVLFDVLGGELHDSLPGAIWLPGAGQGRGFDDAVQIQLAKLLELATGGNRKRALVFYCASKSCWLSYNASLRAVRLGYTQVLWYRGGIQAWLDAGEPVVPLLVTWRRPSESH